MTRRTFFIIPWYRSGDYAAAVALFGDLPGSYAAWRDRALRWEEQCRTSEIPFLRVLVRPGEFRGWCRAVQLQPDSEARSEFIIERARSLLWPDTPADRD
jgi:hypothetical protein